MKQLRLHQQFFSCLLCVFMLCVVGCTNDDYDHITDESNDDYMPVEVTFGGMETFFGPYGDEARNVQYNKIHETQDFDKSRMLETLVMAEPDTLRPPLTRSTSAVTNTTLRIVAYDENNATYMGTGAYNVDVRGNVIARSGEELILKSGKYYFHCISPAQAVSVNDNKISIALPTAGGTANPGIYYAKTASAVQLISNANGKGTIFIPTLQPTCCKLTLSVSHSKGHITTYSNSVLSTTLYKGASLALPAGTVTSNTPVTSTTIAFGSPTIYTYPGATDSFKMTVNGVTVGGVPKGNITTAANSSGMTLTAGNAYKVGVTITPKNYVKITDLPFKVAKGILLYNSGTGKWYLAPDQGYYCLVQNGGYETLTTDDSGYGSSGQKVFSYFNWGVQAKNPNFSLTSSGPLADAYGGNTANTHYGTVFGYNSTSSTENITDVSNSNDPCYAALGSGWHLPTGGGSSADMSYFAKASHTSSSQPYTTKSDLSTSTRRTVTGYYFGTTTYPGYAEEDKYVFLPAAAGYRNSVGDIIYSGSYGYYWSSTPFSSNNAYSLELDKSNVYDGDFDYGRYRGQFVRCISYLM